MTDREELIRDLQELWGWLGPEAAELIVDLITDSGWQKIPPYSDIHVAWGNRLPDTGNNAITAPSEEVARRRGAVLMDEEWTPVSRTVIVTPWVDAT